MDDLIIVPLGIALALTMIPEDVMAESRRKAKSIVRGDKPTPWVAAAVIIAIWLLGAALVVAIVWRVIST